MPLTDEVAAARQEIKADGYDMSIGEIANLYRDRELKIDPAYQRLFRWDDTRKTRFIESLLLGIPIPPIFVYQDDENVWELIDGLQRISTTLQFMGLLQGPMADELGPLVLEGTNHLPSLDGMRWVPSTDGAEDGIGSSLQVQIKRTRLRVEILQPESDASAKFELFQRLNTGGSVLTEQEVRNSIAVMIDPTFNAWLSDLAALDSFEKTTAQTKRAIKSQAHVELALRILAFDKFPYPGKLDVHEYLDQALITLAKDATLDRAQVGTDFSDTFAFLHASLGDGAFRRWNGNAFQGMFLMSVFEVIGLGVFQNIDAFRNMGDADRETFLQGKAKSLWDDPTFQNNSGAGVRGTTRLTNLVPMAQKFMRP